MTDKRRNRVADGAAGGGVGVLIVWLLTLIGVDITPAAASVLTALVVACAAALGRDGIKGIAIHLWHGVNGDDDHPVKK